MPPVDVVVVGVAEGDVDVVEGVLPEGFSDGEVKGDAFLRERDVVDSGNVRSVIQN